MLRFAGTFTTDVRLINKPCTYLIDKIKYHFFVLLKSPYRIELFFWLAGIIYLASINPNAGGHLDLCLFKLYGIDSCPGCGLGRSISFIFHGNLANSIASHPFGFIALILILARITVLIIKSNNYFKIIKGVTNG